MKPRVSHQKTAALTLVEVLVVIVVLAVLATVLLPALVSPPASLARRSECITNLKQIGLAYISWASDNNGKFPMQVSATNGGTMELNADKNNSWLNFLVLSNELITPKILWCPADRDQVTATNWKLGFSAANISYFVSLDAITHHPQMLLSGDDNFAVSGVSAKAGLLEFSMNAPITWTAERHMNAGNISFADGHVEMVNNSDLTNLLRQTRVATNRLAIP